MRLALEHGPGEFDADLAARADFLGQAGKQLARRLVGRRNRGLEITDMMQMFTLQQMAQHRAANPLPAEFVGDGHLPDEQCVFAVGSQVSGQETGQLAVFARHHAGARKVPAQQQIGIGGVVVQCAARAHQGFDVGAVARARLA